MISSSKKNSGKDDIIISNTNNLRNNSNNNIENQNISYDLKLSQKSADKTEVKLYENNKKGKKINYNNSEEELDAKDKLKTLKIEINSKKLEDQIRQLLLKKQN